ncbi:unnamed protein product [Darwinula stevensoni]|uniref:Transporter n=1 Tax=Darwinula stevensoni TaxID=69355 RepID=A0A7R9A924_9CRUS|nr:unnamed protein product [Darwinula stevensoni]CAG0896898.1 unnamed protein product [Darwinula stevensoni]
MSEQTFDAALLRPRKNLFVKAAYSRTDAERIEFHRKYIHMPPSPKRKIPKNDCNGLGNIWKFPYLCYKYGGGAFLLPYTFMLFLVGIPMFLIELTIGQFSALTPIKCFSNMIPLFAGKTVGSHHIERIGITSFLDSMKVIVAYNMIIAWSLYYFGVSFQSDLPWTHCGQDHNTHTNAIGKRVHAHCPLASEEYMKHGVLGITSGLEELGTLQWRLVLSYFAAWALIFISLCKGIRSSGKASAFHRGYSPPCVSIDSNAIFPRMTPDEHLIAAFTRYERSIRECRVRVGTVEIHCTCVSGILQVVYFTATFPYVLMVALLVRGVTLPGAMDGIRFYMVPQWDKVMNIKVWEQALAQILGSLSLGGGGLVTLASYNRFRYNLIRDTWVVGLGNSLTSIFGGFAIFSTLGFMAHQLEVPVDQPDERREDASPQVARGGTSLAFIAYPELIAQLPLPNIWAVLFFFMLITLGLDSGFGMVENISSHFMGGTFIMNFLDYYADAPKKIFLEAMILISVMHFYGIENFLLSLGEMTGFKPGSKVKGHLITLYNTVTPLVLLVIFVWSCSYVSPLTIGGYEYPAFARILGWFTALLTLSAIPFAALYQTFWAYRHVPWNQISGSLTHKEPSCRDTRHPKEVP